MLTPFKLLATAGVVGLTLAAGYALLPSGADDTELVTLPTGTFDYRVAGEYLSDGQPVNPPLVTVTFAQPVAIMQHHVSRADYERCIAARACKPITGNPPSNADVVPAVGVSWHDATAYAAWLSARTGYRYRLPTDAEWAYAAGALFHDNTVVEEGDARNPAKRWIATYESLAGTEKPSDTRPRPFGSFGTNENGLDDVAGNVWDWTATCFARHTTTADGSETVMESCGVRVAEGAHRSYLTDFIRDPKGGACSVGTPPSNLGIRLVREAGEMGPIARFRTALGRLVSTKE